MSEKINSCNDWYLTETNMYDFTIFSVPRDRLRTSCNVISHTFCAAVTYQFCKDNLKRADDPELSDDVTADMTTSV